MPATVLPYPKRFPDHLEDYCTQIQVAIAKGVHHDQRRALLLNFFHTAFGIEPQEIELEHRIKAGALRGRIDAFFNQLIVEVKTDFVAEREDAQRELKKYFASQSRPRDYVGLVTDGVRFETWHLDRNEKLASIDTFTLRADQPLAAWRWFDEYLTVGNKRIPSSDELIADFGVRSPTFCKASDRLLALFEQVKTEPLVAVKFREWDALLAKVYGEPLGKPGLFINHTYLTLISRIIVTLARFGGVPKQNEMRGLLDGSWFARRLRLKNLAEPDFFSWALDTPVEKEFLEVFRALFARFRVFNFDELREDVLKNLYQELVDPETRHDLGEYYTPDWLAQLTLERLGYQGGKILDPACGSGGFLFAAVEALRSTGLKGAKLVTAALENVIGVDVHPVAVLMAKANLLLALRRDLDAFEGDITLRVYMADMLMGDEDAEKGVITVRAARGGVFHIPTTTIAGGDLDELIDDLSDLARRGSKGEDEEKDAWAAARRRLAGLTQDESFYWQQNFRLLLRLDKERRNTIWAYILKNAYRPVFLRREKVDYLAGNPPWLSYRYIKDATYKARVKELTFAYGLLGKDERKLFTQMDTATLFVEHCTREFLRPGGAVGMVLPKTVILPAKQHLKFQRAGFSEVHDFTGVEPLFNVRTCLIVRRPGFGPRDVPRWKWSGALVRRNLPLKEARLILESVEDTASFDTANGNYSPYYDRFLNGATLWPRCLVFVEPVPDTTLNTKSPFLQTAADTFAESKIAWRMRVEGQVEARFLFATVLAKDLLAFAIRRFSLAALPLIENSHGDLRVLDAASVLGEGCPLAYDWFKQAEVAWRKGRGVTKAEFAEWLNYQNKLVNQSLNERFVVLTNKSGTNLVAALVDASAVAQINRLKVSGFVAENVTYRYYAASENEGNYLVGVLNTDFVNEAIKPLQPQGLMGERDIHRRPFEACDIPLFDAKNKLHCEIAKVSASARATLLPIVPKMQQPVGSARAEARKLVANELRRLDELTRELLSAPSAARPEKVTDATQPGLF